MNVSIKRTYKRKSKASRKRMYPKSFTKNVPLPIKKYVQRALGNRVENKVDWNGGNAGYVSNVSAAAPYHQTLNWQTAQGTGQGNRIGNLLTVKSAKLKISLVFAPYDVTSNPKLLEQLVTVVVFKVRSYANGTNPNYSTLFSKMFQNGNSVATLSNTPVDHLQPFNKDVMIVKAIRRFKIGFSNNSSVVTGLGATNIHPNNDFNYQKFVSINCTKFYKKVQRFNDTTTDAYNDNLFFMIYTCPADGSAYIAPANAPLRLSWFWDASYEDA